MKSRLGQFRLTVALALQIALLLVVSGLRVYSQPPTLKRQAPQPPDRGMQVKELRSGGALDGRGRLWAVVIGVSNYKNLKPAEQLEFAHRDAEAFAGFLRSPIGGGFPSSQLTLLTNQSAQVSELNRIITTRLKARTVILIADACHSGQLGWTSRGAAEDAKLVNRYLEEVGKSGKGVVRLMASRTDQRSYEDKRWGGGHGCFTYFLLEGLKGRADRDGDGFVRAGELLDFLSEQVPKATQSLQHPRAAGDIDTRLPMSVIPGAPAKISAKVAASPQMVALEVRGAPGMEVYLDNAFRGRVLPNGMLMIEQIKAGDHDISIISPSAEPINQKLSLLAPKREGFSKRAEKRRKKMK